MNFDSSFQNKFFKDVDEIENYWYATTNLVKNSNLTRLEVHKIKNNTF